MPKRRVTKSSSSNEDESPKKRSTEWVCFPLNADPNDVEVLYFMPAKFELVSSTIASFDLDDTLIETASGLKYPKDRSDWKWWNDCVPGRLQKLSTEQQIVVFSNQGAKKLSSAEKINNMKFKMDHIMKKLGISFPIFFALKQTMHRKPMIGMWKMFSELVDGGLDTKTSFYVGDAAGRPANWLPGRKKDFSCSDRKFAKNVGIGFHTPEEFFLGQKPYPFNFADLSHPSLLSTTISETQILKLISLPKHQEMVVMCGSPASGKSTFALKYLSEYEIVSRDILGGSTGAKCVKAADEALRKGKSVVIDNTNPNSDSRWPFIDLAEKHSVPIRAFVMTTEREVCEHLNQIRMLTGDPNGLVRPLVPSIAFNMFKSKFREPSTDEGFESVVRIPLALNFTSEDQEKMFRMWT